MTTKQSALATLEALKPEPKKRRTAQEQAIDLLVKKRQSLMDRHEEYANRQQEAMLDRIKEHRAKTDAEIVGVDAAIEALRKAGE